MAVNKFSILFVTFAKNTIRQMAMAKKLFLVCETCDRRRCHCMLSGINATLEKHEVEPEFLVEVQASDRGCQKNLVARF